MEHKGIEYQIVQAASPTGWRWTVEVEGKGKKPRSGVMQSRAGAIYKAEQAIDKLVAAAKPPVLPERSH